MYSFLRNLIYPTKHLSIIKKDVYFHSYAFNKVKDIILHSLARVLLSLSSGKGPQNYDIKSSDLPRAADSDCKFSCSLANWTPRGNCKQTFQDKL